MNHELNSVLVDRAVEARQHAYATYSQYPVGAAVLADTGEIFVGCNVENASFGLTICAERAAVFQAVAAGHRKFQAIAVVTPGGKAPCGACLQVLAEFAQDMPITLVDANHQDRIVQVQLAELLPGRFELPPEG